MTAASLPASRVALGAGVGALALIVGALGFQYLGGVQPCEMCHWQRWPHIVAAMLGIGGGLAVMKGALGKAHGRPLVLVVIALILASGLIGAYQTGMQLGILPGPQACTAHRFVLGSNMVPQVQCDVVTWALFGLSLATYNAIFSFLIAGAAAFFLSRTAK